MPREDTILNRWRSQRRPLAAVALTAVLMLLMAPLRTVIGACDLCPPDCPMHAAHRADAAGAHQGAAHKRCHNAPASPDAGEPRIARPSCGSHAAVVSLDLAPMLPPQPLSWLLAPRSEAVPHGAAALACRAADPPDTPPPDARA